MSQASRIADTQARAEMEIRHIIHRIGGRSHNGADLDRLVETIPALLNDNERLRVHIAEQATHVETRIQDGIKLGATVWRIALEDVSRENRAALEAALATKGDV